MIFPEHSENCVLMGYEGKQKVGCKKWDGYVETTREKSASSTGQSLFRLWNV